jgi:AcrR family transcriptional regulator
MKDKKVGSKIEKPRRVASEERHRMIVEAAMPLFAQNGFAATTTKEIAKAAGISEALLYKHFPSKEALFNEMQHSTCSEKQAVVEAIMALPSSTDTLIISMYYFFDHVLNKKGSIAESQITRLMLNSLLEDGYFAKIFLDNRFYPVVDKFVDCIMKAVEAGDIPRNLVPPRLGIWLGHHLVMGMAFIALPGNNLVDYGVDIEELIIHAIRFTLRGLGVKEETIKSKVNRKKLGHQILNCMKC